MAIPSITTSTYQKPSGYKWLIWSAVIIITVVLLLLVSPLKNFFLLSGIDGSAWYAVHLNNGQVYFGHIKQLNATTIALGDTYSLEIFDQADNTQSGQSFKVEAQPQKLYDLVQRGGDSLLASDHQLFINRQSVLFWEKLSAGSDVVRNIKK